MKSHTELKHVHVILAQDLIEEVDAQVDPRQRSRLVAEAVEEKLRQERLRAVVKEIAESGITTSNPAWATPESAAAWVRALREEADRRNEPMLKGSR